MTIKIGTRSSKLALWQAYMIEEKLQQKGFDTEIVTFETKGDKILDKSLSKIGSKGVFTEELESSLLEGSIHLAAHSAKDMPSTLPEGLELIAYTKREEPADVLVSFNPNISLEDNIVVGTSSTRRVATLKHYYPHIKVVDMRGNLQTRFRKMKEGQCDAMILAYAGVHRMEYDDKIIMKLPKEQFTPPVGQGSVTLEVCPEKLGQETLTKIKEACTDHETETCLTVERAFLKTMNGGCSIPLFAYATLHSEQITLKGGIISLDGKEMLREEASATVEQSTTLGHTLAQRLLEKGAGRILEQIRKEL